MARLNVARHNALIAINQTIETLMKAQAWDLVSVAQDWRYALQGFTCKPYTARAAVQNLLMRLENK